MEPITFENLGGLERVKDKRDHVILGEAGVYDFRATKARPMNRPYYFQGHRPACGAHAGVALKSSLDLQAGKQDVTYNPHELWIQIKQDGSSPSTGTTMDRIFKELQSNGCVPFEPLENDVTTTDADYASPRYLTAQQGTTISSYAYPQDKSFEGIKQAIHDFGAVIISIRVCARFWTADSGALSWNSHDILPLAPPSDRFPVVSGHFMVADYYDENYIYGANSFGTTWGLSGDFQMGRDYMPYVTEIGVAHNAPVAPPVPVIASPTVDQVPVLSALKYDQNALKTANLSEREGILLQMTRLFAFLASFINGRNPQGSSGVPYPSGIIEGMPNKTLSPIVASSTDPTEVGNTVKGIILTASSLIIFFTFAFFHITFTQADVSSFADEVGITVGAIWTLFGVIHKVVVFFGSKTFTPNISLLSSEISGN